MSRVRVTLGGVGNGLLMNPMTDETLEQLRTKTSPPKRRDISREEEAQEKLYVDDDGRFGIPSVNLYSCLAEAGREISYKGRSKVSTKESTKLYSFLEIEEEFLLLEGDPEWTTDTRRGRNPNGGEAVCLVRPKFKEWQVKATLVINEKKVNEATVKGLIEEAGDGVGLCDFRPQKRGPFGRFRIAAWEVLEEDAKAEAKAAAGNSKVGKGTARKAAKAVAAAS